MTSWPILFTLTLKALFFIPPLLASDDNILSSPDLRGSILDSVEEFCQWETFNATCSGQDKVVLMSQARYGRMKFGRCVKEDHGSVGCFADVLRVIDEKCSGRRSCTVGVPDATLHNTHPCPKELMPYLEASYLCVTASTWKYRKCTEEGNGDESSSSSSLSGSLSSSSSSSSASSSSSSSSASSSSSPSGSSDTLTGGVVINLPIALNRRQPHLYGKDDDDDDDWTVGRCPWIVQVPQGQRINLTLFTFSRQSASPQQTNQHSNNRIKINTLNGSETAQVGSDCYLQLTILESGSISHNVDDVLASPASSASDATIASLCLSGLRQTNVYQSHSNRLEVSVQLLRHYHPGYNFLHANHINHTGDQLRPQAADVPRRQQQSGVNLHTARFMLRYEALGCPDLLNVTNADVRRNGGNVSIKCLFNSDTFYITCKGNTWIGERLACPGGRYVPLKSSTLYTYGVLTAIGLAVALMVSCVVVIAFSTVAFVRKRSSSKSQNNPIQDPLLKSPATRFKKDVNYESSGDISDKRICRYHYHQQQQHSVQHGENSCEQLDTIDTCNTPDCLLQLRKTEKQSLLQQQHLILCRDDCNFAESGFGTSHGSKIFCNCATDYSNVVDCRCCGCNLDATTKVEFGNDPLILYSSFGKTTCNAQRTLANACGNSERQLSCRQQLQPRACYCVNMDDQRHPDHAMLQAGIVSLQHVHKNLTTNSIHQQQQRGEFVSLDLIKDYGAARTDTTPGDLNETTFSGGRTCPNSSTSGQSGSSVVNITVTNQVVNSNSSYTADDRNINPEL